VWYSVGGKVQIATFTATKKEPASTDNEDSTSRHRGENSFVVNFFPGQRHRPCIYSTDIFAAASVKEGRKKAYCA
jgi:hypothetical protein